MIGLGCGDLVVAQYPLAGCLQRGQVTGAHRDHGVNRLHLRQHRGQDRRQRQIGDHHLILGLVGDKLDLFGEQPNVEGVQHRAHRRHRDVGLQVFLVVPHEGGDPLVAVDAEAAQRIGQSRGLLAKFAVRGVAEPRTGGGAHRPVTMNAHRVSQDRRDSQFRVLHRALHRGQLSSRSTGGRMVAPTHT